MIKRLIGRRDFMKSTLAGVGGLFFLPSFDWKTRSESSLNQRKKRGSCLSHPGEDGIQTSQ